MLKVGVGPLRSCHVISAAVLPTGRSVRYVGHVCPLHSKKGTDSCRERETGENQLLKTTQGRCGFMFNLTWSQP